MTAIRSKVVARHDQTAATSDAADAAFFRMTASLFAPAFLFGAGVLLGTYDDEDDPALATPKPVRHAAPGTATASTAVLA